MNDQVKPPEGSGMKSLQTMKVGGQLAAIYPQSVEEVYRVAQMAIVSGVLKPAKRREKDAEGIWGDAEESREATVARGSMIIMQGLEIGMPPLQALQLIMLVNGRLTVFAEGVPALLWSHGFKVEEWWVDNDGKRHETADGLGPVSTWTDKVAAYCKITRPNGSAITRAFSVGMAKTAKLWDRREKVLKGFGNDRKEQENDAAWFRYPDRMLRARAIGFAAKDGAADALRGMMTSEEALDIQRTQEERERDTLAPIETPAIPFDINLDLAADAAPEREQFSITTPSEAELIPNGNTEKPAFDMAAHEAGLARMSPEDKAWIESESDFPDGLADEPEVVPDDDQELSRASEAKIIGEFSVKLAMTQTREEVGKIERSFMVYANRISDDGRNAIIDAAQEARNRLK